MADAPDWLTATQTTTPPSAPTNQTALMSAESSSQPVETATKSNLEVESGAKDAEVTGEVAKMVLFMRLMNMAVAVLLVVVSVLNYNVTKLSVFILAIYATCGGSLICLLETQLKFIRTAIALNFGFLFNAFWRFIFYFLLAAIAWQYGSIFDQIVAIAIGGAAVFNTYVLCAYPQYRALRDKIAEEEDRRIEAKISGEVKKQATKAALAKVGIK